jgi:hypothetical protein
MTDRTKQQYDAYISCSDADRDWVEDHLRPPLEAAGIKLRLSYEGEGGAWIPDDIEKGIETSGHTILILTPDWLKEGWRTFEGVLATMGDPNAREHKVIPLLLQPCEIPKHSLFRVRRDFRRQRYWTRETQLLIWDLEQAPVTVGQIPVAFSHKVIAWVWRRPLATTLTVGIMLLILSALIGWPALDGWQRSERIRPQIEPYRVERVGNVLLLSTLADRIGCDPTVTGDTGLYRKTDLAPNWSEINPPNCYLKPNQDPQRAALRAFAVSPRTQRIYAATSDVGLLYSDDLGEIWHRFEQPGLPVSQTVSVAVSPADPEVVFVAGQNEGLYRWQTGANVWEPIDGQPTCKRDPVQVLPAHLKWYALLVNTAGVYAGTRYAPAEAPPLSAGLYYSRDGGDCWIQLQAGDERYSYHALATNPLAPDQVLAIVYDHRSPYPNPNYLLWLFGPTLKEPMLFKFKSNWPMCDLFVDSSPDPMWYAATMNGQVVRGPLRDPQAVETLPWVTGCLGGCEVEVPPDLVADSGSNMPLILADYYLYRWGRVAWPEALKQANWLRSWLR